jgi:hypothetical protein
LGPERLEDRTLLSNDVWTGATSSAWSVGSNWSLNQPPGTSDVAEFTNQGSGSGLDSPRLDEQTTIAGLIIDSTWNGTLTLDNSLTLTGSSQASSGSIVFSQASGGGTAGSLTNNGVLTLSGSSQVSWQAADTFVNLGTITLASSNPLQLSSGATLNNSGTIVDQAASTILLLDGGSNLNNQAGGTFEFQADSGVSFNSTAGTFNNAGTLEKASGAGTSTFDPSVGFANSGTVEVLSGTLDLPNAAQFVSGGTLHSGTWLVGSGSTLELGSSISTLAAKVELTGSGAQLPALASVATVASGGQLELSGGASLTTSGKLTNAGNIQLAPGVLNVQGDYIQRAGGTLAIGVGGTAPGSQFGQLNIQNNAALNGALAISLINNFAPVSGQSFAIVPFKGSSGAFSSVTGTILSGPFSFEVSYGASSVSLATIKSSTTTVSSSANPSIAGQSVTFTAQVAATPPNSGTPTGTVTFLDGSTVLKAVALSAGTATYTSSSLAGGVHAISVAYSGDSNFGASVSPVLSENVKDGSTTVLASTINPTVYGQPAVFTATVTGKISGAGTPSGTVTFEQGSTVLGSATLSGGSASFSISTLAVGSDAITAVYSGDSTFAPGSSPPTTQVVSRDATAASLVSSSAGDRSDFGQSVTFSVTESAVSPGSGTPSGSVTFKDGSTTLGSASLNNGGASFTTSALAAGSHAITVSYGGDANFIGGTSAVLTQTVDPDATTASVGTSAVGASSVFGQSVTFTATVSVASPNTDTPTGTVTFKDGSATLGSATLASGSATLTTIALGVGSHSITVVYAGGTDFSSSTSPALTETVMQDGTKTSVASSTAQDSSVFGQSVTFTASVNAASPGGGTPTGSITFMDGSSTLGSVTMASGSATYTTSRLGVDIHSVTAVYGGDTNFVASTSSTLTQTVNQDGTITSVVSSSKGNASVFGQPVTFTATVSAASPGSGTPSGSVTFMDGSAALGTVAINGGSASFTPSRLIVGNHAISVRYGSDQNFTASTSPVLTQTVNRDSTSISLGSSTASAGSVFGQPVTFTAAVSAAAPGGGTPSGTVTFMAGSTTLGTAPLAGGVASLTTGALAPGSDSVTAVYSGDSDFNSSTSPPVLQSVGQDGTSTTDASSAVGNSSVFGQPVTFTATVSPAAPGGGTPTGKVVFRDGAATLGTVAVAGGSASLTISSFQPGSHSIVAVYSGDSDFLGNLSAATMLTVSQAGTTTGLALTSTSTIYGQLVTLTASVAVVSPGAGTPAGSVEFLDGPSVIATTSLNADTASFSITTLAVGVHSLTARYLGGSDFTASTSIAGTLTVTGTSTATATSVSSRAAASVVGQSVTLTATVTPAFAGSSAPTGSVSFYDGPTDLGSATLVDGKASFKTGPLALGSHTITAVYAGGATYNGSTSAAFSQTVGQDGTTTSLTSSFTTSVFGQSVTLTASVAAAAPGSGTPTGSVIFKDGATILGSGTLNTSGAASLSIDSLPVGTSAITAAYGGDSNYTSSSSTAASQTVIRDDTSTSLSSALESIVFGQSVTFTVVVRSNVPGNGTPTGTIRLAAGSTTLGYATLHSGSAQFTRSALGLGNQGVTAVYNGDGDFNSSTSSAVSESVGQDAAMIVITPAANPANAGSPIRFVVTVAAAAPGGGTPTGMVILKDRKKTLGSIALSGGSATFTSGKLALGTHSIQVIYSGDANFKPQTSAILSEVVKKSKKHKKHA